MAAVNVNHNINFSGMSDLTKSLEIFTSKLDSIAQSFTNPQSAQNNSSTTTTSTNTDQAEFTKTFETHGKKVEELTSSFNNYAETDKIKIQLNKDLNKNLQDLNKKMETTPKDSGTAQTSFMKNLVKVGIIGAAATIGNEMATRGSIAGSAQQSLNTGILGSSDFVQNYQSQMMLNTQSMKNTGASLAGGLIAGIASGFNPIAMAAGATAAGTAYGYFGNKGTQQDIANNQFMLSRDQEAWQVKNAIGAGTTNQFKGGQLGFDANGKRYASSMSNLQAEMFGTPSLSAYANYANTYQLNANRQQFRNEGGTGNNVKNIVNAGMAMGVSEQNMPSFVNVATTAAQATGQDTNKILNKMLEVNTRYGGDTVKNTGQALQLMQTSHVTGSFGDAAEIAARYQYNPAALQNKINASNTSPMNKFVAGAYGKILGLSEEEIASGELNATHKGEYRKGQSATYGSADPRLLLMDTFSGLRGQDINVNNDFGVLGKSNAKGQSVESMTPSASMSAMGDFITESLKNLKVDTQNVTATTVNVYGGNHASTPAHTSAQFDTNMNNKYVSARLSQTAGNGTSVGDQILKSFNLKEYIHKR